MCIPKFEHREASAVVQVIYGQALRMPNFEKECAEQSITRHQWISEAAYYKAEARAFEAGRELNDWLAAEKDYTEMLITAYLSVFEEDGGMTKANLQQLAKAIGVENPEGISNKTGLMRVIQNASQQRPCFRSDNYMSCEDKDCIWRTECLKLVAVWMR
ncbi:MAG: DUF2934 domain-containing protein [Methylobacter tundripaludum]|nr:DUF2934 domain-containing protein [Methylobacter tundripaludum]